MAGDKPGELMSTDTGGVKPMGIAGRMVYERERLFGMTDEERRWRAQWLKDQILSHHEPRRVPEYEAALTNPIKRIYRAPLDIFAKALTPVVGYRPAWITRWWLGKIMLGLTAVYSTAYYFKYNRNDWTRKGGWRVVSGRERCVPGDPGYPKTTNIHKSDYADYGFKKGPL